MAGRRKASESSLELLLDTICNTFGGVLFLAMLVSLMLTQTRRKTEDAPAEPTPAVSAADLVRLETRAENAARDLESLEAQAQQARRAAGLLAVPHAAELIASMEATEQRAREAETRRTELLTKVAREQASAARAEAAKADDARTRKKLAADAEEARKRLADAVKARDTLVTSAIKIRDDAATRATVATTGRAPRMRATTKLEFAMMLKYGRLYLMKELRDGNLVVNEADFLLTPGLLANVAEAKPHAGVDLSSEESREAGLRRVTASFPPSKWYACLVIFPDSFEEYLTAKNWLVQRGYEVRLIPTTESVHDSGASDTQVQ